MRKFMLNWKLLGRISYFLKVFCWFFKVFLPFDVDGKFVRQVE
jgi:hypothetical protein